jgi:hypothetical protein
MLQQLLKHTTKHIIQRAVSHSKPRIEKPSAQPRVNARSTVKQPSRITADQPPLMDPLPDNALRSPRDVVAEWHTRPITALVVAAGRTACTQLVVTNAQSPTLAQQHTQMYHPIKQ